MHKYDWKNIPASIKWIAKDCDDRFYGFNHEPFRNPWGFGINEGFAKRLYISNVQVAWQESLEQRPNEPTMSECNKADHQINPLELFEIFFTSITPVMTPIGIRSQGMQAIHHFWKQRFLNVFRGISEDKRLDQFSDLPILWLSAWKHQQEKVEELEKEWLEMNQELEKSRQVGFEVEKENKELQKRLEGALKETQYALQYVEEDMRGNHEFLQMAMIRTFKALEQVLKGGEFK